MKSKSKWKAKLTPSINESCYERINKDSYFSNISCSRCIPIQFHFIRFLLGVDISLDACWAASLSKMMPCITACHVEVSHYANARTRQAPPLLIPTLRVAAFTTRSAGADLREDSNNNHIVPRVWAR
jgi:hypothetical protein